MNCDSVSENLEAYALDILNSDEANLVAQHLSTCQACQTILQDYEDIVVMLPDILADASPQQAPSLLKDRLMAQLDEESEATIATPVSTTHSPDVIVNSDLAQSRTKTERSVSESLPETQEVSQLAPDQTSSKDVAANAGEQRPRSLITWPRWGLGAAGALFVVLLAWGLQINSVLARERELRTQFANLYHQQEIVLEVVDSDKRTKRFLRPVEEGSRSYGKLYTRNDMAHVVVMAARLPQPSPNEAYHVWLTLDDQTTLAGTLEVNEDGFGILVFDADRDGPIYQAAQLTLQPLGSDDASPDILQKLTWELTPVE